MAQIKGEDEPSIKSPKGEADEMEEKERTKFEHKVLIAFWLACHLGRIEVANSLTRFSLVNKLAAHALQEREN